MCAIAKFNAWVPHAIMISMASHIYCNIRREYADPSPDVKVKLERTESPEWSDDGDDFPPCPAGEMARNSAVTIRLVEVILV